MIKKFNQYNNFAVFSVLTFFYLIVRIFVNKLGIVTDPGMIRIMWQIMDLNLLKDNFINSIYYLHYQPPLWNIIIGIMVKLFGNKYSIISETIYYFNILISLFSIWIFLLTCKIFNLKNSQIFLVSLFFVILSVSYLFYENYTHYTHLTTLLFILFIYNYLKFSENFKTKYEIYIYLTSTALVYLWSAFSHPIFIILIFFTIILNKYDRFIYRSLIIFFFFFLLSIAPSIKNKYEVNFFGNSSWIGFQTIQTLNAWDALDGKCVMNYNINKSFQEAYKNINPNFNNNHPSLVGDLSKWNNVGTIYLTKKCLKKSIDIVKNNPIDYLKKVKFNFISTHGHYSFDHTFTPLNWKKLFGFLDKVKNTEFSNSVKVRSLQLYFLIFYLFFTICILKSLKTIKKTNQYKLEKVFASLSLIYFWMIILSHFFAAYEHERMRHIGHYLHAIFFIVLINEKFKIKNLFTLNNEIKINTY